MDEEKDKQKRLRERKFRELLTIEDLVPKWVDLHIQNVCFTAANKDAIKFKELYEEWLYSDVYKFYVLILLQNRLEREQFDAD